MNETLFLKFSNLFSNFLWILTGLRAAFVSPAKVKRLRAAGKVPNFGVLVVLVVGSVFFLAKVIGDESHLQPFTMHPGLCIADSSNMGEFGLDGSAEAATADEFAVDPIKVECEPPFSRLPESGVPIFDEIFQWLFDFLVTAAIACFVSSFFVLWSAFSVFLTLAGVMRKNSKPHFSDGLEYMFYQTFATSLVAILISAAMVLFFQVSSAVLDPWHYFDLLAASGIISYVLTPAALLHGATNEVSPALLVLILAISGSSLSASVAYLYHSLLAHKYRCVFAPGLLLTSSVLAFFYPLVYFFYARVIYIGIFSVLCAIYTIAFYPIYFYIAGIIVLRILAMKGLLIQRRMSRKKRLKITS